MMPPYRVDYAAQDHGEWLSHLRCFHTAQDAVREAQNKMAGWPVCIGFRIVTGLHPLFEKMTPEHLGKMVDEHGQIVLP